MNRLLKNPNSSWQTNTVPPASGWRGEHAGKMAALPGSCLEAYGAPIRLGKPPRDFIPLQPCDPSGFC
jgi:hypothetical protein